MDGYFNSAYYSTKLAMYSRACYVLCDIQQWFPGLLGTKISYAVTTVHFHHGEATLPTIVAGSIILRFTVFDPFNLRVEWVIYCYSSVVRSPMDAHLFSP
jgi:hypothetical protein